MSRRPDADKLNAALGLALIKDKEGKETPCLNGKPISLAKVYKDLRIGSVADGTAEGLSNLTGIPAVDKLDLARMAMDSGYTFP